MRISATQQGVLLALYIIEKKGNFDPVPSIDLFNIVNKVRDNPVHDTNFRTSCHTLEKNKQLFKYRSRSLNLAWSLTDEGRKRASQYYDFLVKKIKTES